MLVAGAAGFIGSHLCEALLARGDQVVALDNLLTGSRRNLASLEGRRGFDWVQADVTEPLPSQVRFDWLLHLASPASPVDYAAHPVETLRAGTLGTLQLLELARGDRAGFLLASTSEVYGDPLVHPQVETYWGNVNPVGPRACYDEAKRCAEAYTATFARAFDMDVRIVRIFNTHGPRMRADDGRVVPNFMTQAQRGQPLTVYGDGSQTRSLCYVDDLVDGLLAAIDRGDREPVNLGNPAEVSVLELARRVIELTGSRSQIEFRPLPADDPRQRCPDITRARERLGWEPRVPLEAGLRETWAYFRQLDRSAR